VIRAPARPRRLASERPRGWGRARTVYGHVYVTRGYQKTVLDVASNLFPFAVTYVTKRPRRLLFKGARPTSSPPDSENTPAMRARRLEYGGCGEG
jgi:hypothetical protein